MPLALSLGVEEHVYSKYFDVTNDIEMLPKADLVVFPGGGDWHPSFYGKEPHPNTYSDFRYDEFTWIIAKQAICSGKMLAGHCRGAQLLCILNGDRLIQHTTGHTNGLHDITTNRGNMLKVNSIHHQMMLPTKNFELLAWSSENLSDRYETTDDMKNILHLQIEKEPEAVYFNKIKGLLRSEPATLDMLMMEPEPAFFITREACFMP